MQTAVSDLIDELHDQPSWWYGIHFDTKSPHSLCNLLGIEPDDYHSFLRSMDLVDSRCRINREKTETLATSLVGTNWQWYKTNGKKQIFICIGKHPNKKNYPTHPEAQVDLHSKKKIVPPKRSSDIAAKQIFSNLWNEYKTNTNDGEKKERHVKNKKGGNKTSNLPSVVVTPLSKTSDVKERQTEKQSILNILGRELLSKIFNEEALQDVVRLYRSSLTIEEVLDSVAATHIQVRQKQADLLRRKKEALEHATRPQTLIVDPLNYPFMKKKGINVTSSDDMGRLLREVSKMQKEVIVSGSVDIFKFLQHNDKPTTLIRIPTNSTRKNFEINLLTNKNYNWVDRTLKAMLPPPPNPNVITTRVGHDGEQEEEREEDEDDVAVDHDRMNVRWESVEQAAEGLIVHLGRKFGAAFVQAGQVLGMPVAKMKGAMDVETSAALSEDVGLTNTQKMVVNKYTIHHLGHPLTAPAKKIRALGNNAVRPVSGEVQVGKETCSFWRKDPVEVITKKIAETVAANPTLEWDNLDIILGGDHGGGAFRVPITLKLKKEKVIKKELEVNIGYVACKKDTSAILRATIMSYLNERLKVIVQYERDEATNKILNDGTINEYSRREDGSNDVVLKRFSFNDDVAAVGENLVQKRPIKLLVTGDLAFYALILGMENASPYHCWLCLLRKVEWEDEPFKNGDIRSMRWILNNYQRANRKQGGRVNGVIERPLLDAVDTSRFVVPPLHCMLGITNTILNDFKLYVDILLEDSPAKLKKYRSDDLLAENAFRKKGEELSQWGSINGARLAECHETRMDLLTSLEYMIGSGEGTEGERESLMDEVSKVEEDIANLYKQRETLVDEEATLLEEWKKKKKKVKDFQKSKDGKKYLKPVKGRLEAALKKWGIDYAAYHGGDLVGNDCRKLMRDANSILQEIKSVLLAVASEKRKGNNTKEAITSRCDAVRDALVVFDAVFSIMFKRNSKVVMETDLPRLKELLQKALVAWSNLKDKNERGKKNITPKVHAMLVHMPQQFETYGGIGDYDEQFVERSHQVGKKDTSRSRGTRCPKKKYNFHAVWEAIRNRESVKARQQQVRNDRKRKFKDNREENKEKEKEEASKQRSIQREEIISQITPRDLSEESARILSLMELEKDGASEAAWHYDSETEDGEGGGGTMMEEADDMDIDDDGSIGSIVGAEDC